MVLLGLTTFDCRKIQTVMVVDESFMAAAAAGLTSRNLSSSSANLLEEDRAPNIFFLK
jgi:hypothetical protein